MSAETADTWRPACLPGGGAGVLTWYGQAARRWWALVPWFWSSTGAALAPCTDVARARAEVAALLRPFLARRWWRVRSVRRVRPGGRGVRGSCGG
ncbi:hypothetical protein E1293_36400 [Actinomadura darangshiensis]|uniref:Uncharacterized protein n=1 Tax=Actinomadura darangshiensis TaxID=705336 RepID=A0A4R5AA43_9ACTN|nr:hypothetical protein [Actinomadura darangshiensis]TDD68991.1 hypothetical protein E1293_36400 [Actinomadura darangshiensis]